MAKLTITIGLPGAGKTTWAYHQRNKNMSARAIVVIERDEIRERQYGSRKDFLHEDVVTRISEAEVTAALLADNDVIVSDTNLSTKVQKRWRALAARCSAEFESKSFLDIPIEEVLRRDSHRQGSEMVGADVIMDFARRYNLVKAEALFAQVPFDTALPLAIIVDIDGTCALMGDRSPYEHGKYHLDRPCNAVRDVVSALAAQGNKIVYCSGRKEAAREETWKWLNLHGFPDGRFLYMRKDDDNRKDSIVKYEILRDEISYNFFPALVLDDRNQVVEMWRSQGIPTFQVAEGNF